MNGVYGQNIDEFFFVGLEGQSGYQSTHTLMFNENSNTNWTDDWDNINNCSVIAYVYNSETLIIEEGVLQHIINE